MLVVVYWSELSTKVCDSFHNIRVQNNLLVINFAYSAYQFQVDYLFSLGACFRLAQNHNRFLTVKALCAIVGAFSYYYCEILMLALVMPAAGSAPFD